MYKLKEKACFANTSIAKMNLSPLTWGNASIIDREKSLIAIKPSGVGTKDVKIEDIVIIDMDGNIVSGEMKASVDTQTHCLLYKNFSNVGSIFHTHSPWATIWSQIGKDIPILGTTHSDYFKSHIPCTRPLLEEEVSSNYENNIAYAILEKFKDISYNDTPAVLVHSHGPFIWGENVDKALNHAIVLEFIANIAWHTSFFTQKSIPNYLINKHFYRKHGDKKYYGQI